MGGAGGGICFDVSRFSDRQTKMVTLSLDLFIQFDFAAGLFRKIKLLRLRLCSKIQYPSSAPAFNPRPCHSIHFFCAARLLF